MSRTVPFLVVVAVWLFLEAPVEAYLDPGSGSMLLYWNRLVALFRRKDAPGDGR